MNVIKNNGNVKNFIYLTFGTLLLIMLAISPSVLADQRDKYYSPPKGLDKYLVFVGDGIWQSVDGSIMHDGIIKGDGMFFQREIMKRTEEEIIQHKIKAIEFFRNRFGLEVLANENIYFTGFYVDPRNRLRAYSVSGEKVPTKGWKVRDGGWGVFVINPEGVDLGGEFEGVNLPINSALFYGDYNIKVTEKGHKKDNIVIHYETDLPFIFDRFGAGMIRCRLNSEEYGDGLAGGIVDPVFLDDNFLMKQNVRNILTFPGVINESITNSD